jgi:UDP-glucose:(heptosyl)LPS alpha-1,3-glucosyltransferase
MQQVVAFCLFKYFPYGGLQSDFMRIAVACQKRGFNIVVYVRSWEGPVPDGFEVRTVPVKAFSNHGKAHQYVQWVSRALKKNPVAAVVGFNRMPGLDVYFAADNCYAQKAVNQRISLYRLSPRYRIYKALENSVFSDKSNAQILLISEPQKHGYIEFYGTSTERLHLLPPGMDRARRRPNDAEGIRRKFRNKLNIGDNECMLIQVGSGFVTKGLERSIRALASLPEQLLSKTRLFVVGQDRAERFKRLAKKLGIEHQVVFLGGRDDVPSLLLAADLMVHPSVNEAAGIVLLEALAAGLPVVCTAACGHALHVERSGGGSVLAEPFSQEKLNERLCRLLSEGNLLEFGKNGLAYAEATDLYSQHERAADLIEDIARKKR